MVARRLERPEHNVDAGLDVRIIVLELADRGLGAQQGRAAARTMPSSLNVLGDEEQRLGGLDRGLENRQQLEQGEFFLVDEDVGVLEPRPPTFRRW
jgi:hypothetical protein